MIFYHKIVFCYIYSSLAYLPIASSKGIAPTVLEYGPGYTININFLIKKIPSGVTTATVYYVYGDETPRELLSHNVTKHDQDIIYICKAVSEPGNQKNITLFADINYPNNKLCGRVFIMNFVYNSSYYNAKDPTPETCSEGVKGLLINFQLNNTCRNSTDNHITSPGPSEEVRSLNISYHMNNERICPKGKRNDIRKIKQDKNISADTETICYMNNDKVTFTCDTTASNIQWLQTFGGNKDDIYYIKNDDINNITTSMLNVTLLKSDHLSTVFCKAIYRLQSTVTESNTKAYALINIDEVTSDKTYEGSTDVEDTSLEISYLRPHQPINHTCSNNTIRGYVLAKYDNGETEFLYNNTKRIFMNDTIEVYCIGFSVLTRKKRMLETTIFSRFIYNRKKYVIEHIDENRTNWPLMVGVPAAIIIGAVLSIVAFYITQLVKRSRESRHGNNALDLVIYSTANEIHYAQLSITQESPGIIRGREEMTPYAEIIGVLEPKAKD